MLALTRMGAVMVPPMPAFYNHPQCVGDIIDHVAMRVLDQFGIEAPVDTPRWSGLPHPRRPEVVATADLISRYRPPVYTTAWLHSGAPPCTASQRGCARAAVRCARRLGPRAEAARHDATVLSPRRGGAAR